MHEFSLCRGVLQQVTRIAEAHHAIAINAIHLHIGPLAGVEVELLERAFPLVSRGTIAEHATLEVTRSVVTIYCAKCGNRCEPKRLFICNSCHSSVTELLSGDEMRIENIVLKKRVQTDHVH